MGKEWRGGVHSRDRIRDEEATKRVAKCVFAPLSKRRFLRRSVIQRDALVRDETREEKKVMACNVTLCDCGRSALLFLLAWVAVRYARLARIVRCSAREINAG